MKKFAQHYTVMNLDLISNDEAQVNFVLQNSRDTLNSLDSIKDTIEKHGLKFDGIMVTAGGWNGKCQKIDVFVLTDEKALRLAKTVFLSSTEPCTR